jgi:N-acetylglucosamine kinase-like BadF-type ATPase
MPANLVIGIDAGGSKTLALAAEAQDGAVLARGEAGPANYQAVGPSTAFASLDAAVGRALEAAGGAADGVTALCLGAAGMDRAEDFALFQGWAAQHFPAARVRLVNDARIVLAAGTPEGWGLALISGTGSIAYGRTRAGEAARAGGWGYLLGDEGSGYDIGLQALRSVTRAADGRDTPTLLLNAILAAWGLTRAQDLVRKVYGGLARAEIARLSAVVEECAASGDPRALEILDQAGAELARSAGAVIRRLAFDGPVPTALTGGVLVGGERVRHALLRAAGQNSLLLSPTAIVPEPARGAVRLALESLG